MSTLDTTHEHASETVPESVPETTRRSWWEMATEGIDVCEYAPGITFPGDPHLQQVIRMGREIKAQIDQYGSGHLLRMRDPRIATIQLRVYLGAIAGELDGVYTLEDAELAMGIRSSRDTTKQEWK